MSNNVPTPYVEHKYGIKEILFLAGFEPSQYSIREDVDYWTTTNQEPDYESSDGNLYVRGDRSPTYTYCFARKSDDGIWEISRYGTRYVFRGLRFGPGGKEVWAKSTLSEMGISPELVEKKIEAAKAARREEYCAKVKIFVEDLKRNPIYHSLSLEIKAVLGRGEIPDDFENSWSEAVALHQKVLSGEILTNFGGYFRNSGRTFNRNFWVIRKDGSEHDPDVREYSPASKIWRVVQAEEIALLWGKANSAGPHEFVVEKKPSGGCSQEQLETISRIQREIEERWEGARGLASGKPSPSIGEGWGLLPPPAIEVTISVAQGGESASEDALSALRDRFARR